ncbi:hypothetical protein CK203_092902 [Vitis vinifera]|uniref:Uncharacterized protein n=1 Tax=Vitis vinifera TaxID=29760 RepID=A0A438EJH4_VITVI|nr:hypothetical protein CK203_092902 [Vitis vinifera]
MWLKEEGCKDVMRNEWVSYFIEGCLAMSWQPSYKLRSSILKFGMERILGMSFFFFPFDRKGKHSSIKENEARGMTKEEYCKWAAMEEVFQHPKVWVPMESLKDLAIEGFKKEEVGWLIELLTKAIELKSHLGFNRKYRGKSCVHLMEVCFNNHGRFIRISEFATNRKPTFLVIAEGEKGKDCGKWVEVGRAVARSLGKKGVATIVPFSGGKSVFFVETVEEALFLQDLRFIKIEGGNSVQLRRWSPKGNLIVEGKFRGGWIELRGLPFHLWSEVHLKKIVEQWGTMTEIDWRTLKLFDLSKVRVRIAMKDRSILPALIEVIGED